VKRCYFCGGGGFRGSFRHRVSKKLVLASAYGLRGFPILHAKGCQRDRQLVLALVDRLN